MYKLHLLYVRGGDGDGASESWGQALGLRYKLERTGGWGSGQWRNYQPVRVEGPEGAHKQKIAIIHALTFL